jgi:hypothetical protein
MYPLLIISLLAAPMVICFFAFVLKSREVGIGEFFGKDIATRIKTIWFFSAAEFDDYEETAE